MKLEPLFVVMKFAFLFSMKFSFVGFKKFRFLAIIHKNMRDMGMNPSVKMERIELSIRLWGLFGASTRSDQGILIMTYNVPNYIFVKGQDFYFPSYM